MRATIAISLLILGIATLGCKKGSDSRRPLKDAGPEPLIRLTYPGTPDGALAVVTEFTKPHEHPRFVFNTLRPDPEDYDAVFMPEAADKVRSTVDMLFTQGHMSLILKGPTQVLIAGATTEELAAGTGNAAQCPKGYRVFAKHMRPGITMYCFRFVDDGHPSKAHDGLIYVNGHWAVFTKAYFYYRQGVAEAGILDDED